MWHANQYDRSRRGRDTDKIGNVPACATHCCQCPEFCRVIQTVFVVAGKQKCLMREDCVSAFIPCLHHNSDAQPPGVLYLKGQICLQVRNMGIQYHCVCFVSRPVWEEKGICSAADTVRNCRLLLLPGVYFHKK